MRAYHLLSAVWHEIEGCGYYILVFIICLCIAGIIQVGLNHTFAVVEHRITKPSPVLFAKNITITNNANKINWVAPLNSQPCCRQNGTFQKRKSIWIKVALHSFHCWIWHSKQLFVCSNTYYRSYFDCWGFPGI